MVLLYGEPRLWREALKISLAAVFGADAIQEYMAPDLSAEFLARARVKWLVAFLPLPLKAELFLRRMAHAAPQTHILVLSGDGSAIVRWSDRMELRRSSISLEQVLEILQLSGSAAYERDKHAV